MDSEGRREATPDTGERRQVLIKEEEEEAAVRYGVLCDAGALGSGERASDQRSATGACEG